MQVPIVQSGKTLSPFGIVSGWLLLAVLIFGVWKGPYWMGPAAMMGLLFGLTELGLKIFRPKKRRLILPLVFCFVHVAGLIASVGLGVFFLTEPQNALRLPRFGFSYQDPSGAFSLVGPINWRYFPIEDSREMGVQIIPPPTVQQNSVSEVQLIIRRLETPPASPEGFLLSMADNLNRAQSRASDQEKQFNLQSRSSLLLDGEPGVISVLDAKALWIPIRQVSLYGIKDDQFLVSITATSVQARSRLSETLCQGLFKTLKINRDEF